MSAVVSRPPSRPPVPQPRDRARTLTEASMVYATVAAVIWGISRVPSPLVQSHLHLIVGSLFLATALGCVDRLPGGAARYGMALGGLLGDVPAADDAELTRARTPLLRMLCQLGAQLLRELLVAFGVCALLFPPFIAGFYYWHAPARAFAWPPGSEPIQFTLTQLLVVGLPEEALFRGYLQGRLSDAWPQTLRVLGAQLPWRAWLVQAALFALLHVVVDYNPTRLAVFFPGLLFGWLRAQRGGIGAAIVVHAACNLLSDTLIRGWL